MGGQLLASVVIPTNNRADLLQDTLAGLAAQTLKKSLFEVIVVDDCSTDNTQDVLMRLQPILPFSLRIFRTAENKGPAPARNLGVKKADGEIIAFTDSDCRPSQEWLEKGVTAMRNTNIAMATGVVDFKSEQLSRHNLFSRKTVVCDFEHPTYPTANAFYKRSVFLELNGFDENLSFPSIFGQAVEASDTDLAWRLKEAGYKNVFIKDAVVYHEVQTLKSKEWLLEPLRLFLLPALIRLHPGLRQKLLSYGLFFYKRSPFYYLLLFFLLFIWVLCPKALLLTPFILVTEVSPFLYTV